MEPLKEEIDKLSKAEELKLAGNQAYSSKDYRHAISKYHRALLYLRGFNQCKPSLGELMSPSNDKKIPDNILQKKNALSSECYNNLAACLLMLKEPNYERVVECCQQTLDLNPGNLKAIFRMGTALVNLGNYEKAKEILTSNEACATACTPNPAKYKVLDKASSSASSTAQQEKKIQQLLATVNSRLKESEKKLQEAYKKMFQTKLHQPGLDASNTTTALTSSEAGEVINSVNGEMCQNVVSPDVDTKFIPMACIDPETETELKT